MMYLNRFHHELAFIHKVSLILGSVGLGSRLKTGDFLDFSRIFDELPTFPLLYSGGWCEEMPVHGDLCGVVLRLMFTLNNNKKSESLSVRNLLAYWLILHINGICCIPLHFDNVRK